MTLTTKSLSGSRLLAISDIHGHSEALLQLLQEAKYDPAVDQLFLLGDFIDADNPATWDTLDIIQTLIQNGARALLGNQEIKLSFPLKRGKRRSQSYWKWLRTLPCYITQDNYLFVHAGLRPGIPLNKQSMYDLTEIREAFYAQPASTLVGVEAYTIVFGHTPTYKLGAVPGEIWYGERRICIDTGAKHGMRLTLLDLTDGVIYSCATEAR